ncbi:hypothetical protein H5392_10605 [Tessaracoccus sp. MC1865]|uniref:hypothetical protein n=1 Tax=Tessaracoccus sp. MC1865 TaxID=2760310 RepID=UPI0016046DCF|nr:hypothetical protein [Tessaracoccus sp. MC1865]MBB1484307.1 hypothetical protein [Tessaracoccus sp. MC1865]QTO38575.1 hypothetical protein J7D54_05710 [Tessaracoccus sp. MC1865]
MTQASDVSPTPPGWKRAFGILGILAHLVVGYIYLTVGLVTPMPWLLGFWVIWVVLLLVCLRLLRDRPLLVLLVPVLALGILIGGLSLGEALLGWSA